MILFVADNHYDTHAGKALFECLEPHYDIDFHEDDWRCFRQPDLAGRCALLMLNLIGDTCDVPPPGPEEEKNVYAYVQAGRPLFLLHGASAAFWQSPWWRALVGFRWVRKGDPDGFAPSSHPVQPYCVEVAKSRHPLCRRLRMVDMPEDEIYTELEQTGPATILMETTIAAGTFPMSYETTTPWGGKIVAYIPGHAADVVRLEGNVANCRAIIDYLLAAKPGAG